MKHIRAQCREFQEKFPQEATLTTVWAIQPNVRVYQTWSTKGILHTHGMTCKRASYKGVHRLLTVYNEGKGKRPRLHVPTKEHNGA